MILKSIRDRIKETMLLSERFIRSLKNKIYKYTTVISKNVYIDKLDNIVNKYNNTNHRTVKRKPIGVKSNIYIYFEVKNIEMDLEFKVGGHVRISKYNKIQ